MKERRKKNTNHYKKHRTHFKAHFLRVRVGCVYESGCVCGCVGVCACVCGCRCLCGCVVVGVGVVCGRVGACVCVWVWVRLFFEFFPFLLLFPKEKTVKKV